jgi:threonine dehydratase
MRALTHDVELRHVLMARRRLEGRVRRTPLETSLALSTRMGCQVGLKLESEQLTGAFKIRGATSALLALDPAARARGIVAASTGNHGRALASAARDAGARAIICLSQLVPEVKVEAIRALGAEVRRVGRSQDDAQLEVDRLVAEQGLVEIPPFDHPDVIAGQGTIGLEIAEDEPEVDTVLVPMSGGGLIAGVGLALKEMLPAVKVIGVSMERGAAMAASVEAGRPVDIEEVPTLADSLGGGIGTDNRHTLRMVQEFVDDVVLLSEAEIAEGMRHAYWHERRIVEGAAAVGMAALVAGRVANLGRRVVCLVSGRNVDMEMFSRVVTEGWNGPGV